MYAVIEAGGKQYQVAQGSEIKVERLDIPEGGRVELDHILMVAKEGNLFIGEKLKGAKVIAEVVEQGRGKKITVMKFKRRKHYRRKMGHRQMYTSLLIKEIQLEE